MSTINLGTINLGSKVMVSDPCYETGTWCQSEIDILSGEYECFINNSYEGAWGYRISSLTVKRKDAEIVNMSHRTNIGVDSGQAGIFDYDYYLKYHPVDESKEALDEEWYKRVCQITLNEPDGGTIDSLGVVSSSGYGDGSYDVFVGTDCNGYVVFICIKYIY